ncbi:hypothetical protein SESBI_34704 [Sesbania bispinosa]|nr:hypothetical protein SESBI_34704 [Sesbania bispinosa]
MAAMRPGKIKTYVNSFSGSSFISFQNREDAESAWLRYWSGAGMGRATQLEELANCDYRVNNGGMEPELREGG